jgi:hypothetical protein
MDTSTLTGPPLGGTEIECLLGGIERQRRTLAWKCEGLDAVAMTVRLGPSALTLGGLIVHLTRVEETQFQWKLHGRQPAPPWDTAADDVEFTAADQIPDDIFADWLAAVARSRAAVAEALAAGGLDFESHVGGDGRQASLRNLLVDMLEEYARHTGHADLIRESIDGRVGEDPPD